MICIKCGAENDDGTKFCSTCGNRLDGKKECPFCHAEIKEASVFCSACGKRVDGKKVCPVCGNVMGSEDRFCNACGYDYKSVGEKSISKNDFKSKTENVLFYVKNALALLVMIFAFIGTFVVGYSLNIKSDDGTIITKSIEIIGNYDSFKEPFKGVMMVFQILAIAGTATIITLGLIFFFAKKKNISEYAIASLFLLLLPIALCSSMFVLKDNSNAAYEITGRLSDLTLVMMILCFIFVAATIVVDCVDKSLKDKKTLLPNCLGSVNALLIGIALLSFGFTAVDFVYNSGSTYKVMTITNSGGIFAVFEVVLAAFGSCTLENIGLCFLLIGLAITCLCGIFKVFEFNKCSLVCGIVGLVLQIASLICMFRGVYNILDNNMEEVFNLSVSTGYIIGMPISAIACGLNITHFVVKKNAATNGADA